MADSQRPSLLVLYGSQTGNAQVRLRARMCAAAARQPHRSRPARLHESAPAHCPHTLLPQDVAERIAREAARRHYRPRVMPADAYLSAVASLPGEAAVVFVASTTGQGDVPANMRQLWRFLLLRSLPPGSLAAVRVAVFGLGDSGAPALGAPRWRSEPTWDGRGVLPRSRPRCIQHTGPPSIGTDQHRHHCTAPLLYCRLP